MTTQPHGPTYDDLVGYLARTRWFGGKGRPFRVTGVRRVGDVPGRVEDGPRVSVDLVELTYDDAEGGTELYQVPLAAYPEPVERLEHALVGTWRDEAGTVVHAYDALHDKHAMACWLRTLAAAEDEPDLTRTDDSSGLVFRRLPGHRLDTEVHSTLFSGEQSNSSVAFGEDSLMKVFRKVTPGVNPDIAIHEVLTTAGSEHIAALFGWVEWRDPDSDDGTEVVQLAMLQQFLRTATDGWDLALASVRDLFAEADLHAHEVGGDFAGEAARLGEALRDVHALLAERFPTEDRGPEAARDLAAAMGRRLDDALAIVPDLGEHADALRALYARVGELDRLRVQKIHGDLHLGQTLRTALGWKIVDFEGEPAKPLAERQLPDSPWRDVAGMLRSFDYAPHVVDRSSDDYDPDGEHQRHYRAAEWGARNKLHFLEAYAGGEVTEEERVLLEAYVADKAVYETVYETRNRPTWVPIPLEAIARIGAS